jgi:hypothetical protein
VNSGNTNNYISNNTAPSSTATAAYPAPNNSYTNIETQTKKPSIIKRGYDKISSKPAKQLNKALKETKDYEGIANEGKALYNQKKYQEAIYYFNDCKTEREECKYYLALCYLENGFTKKGKMLLEEISKSGGAFSVQAKEKLK